MYARDVFTVLSLIFASISVVAGILQLWLVYVMGKNSGFLWLVVSLCIAQLFFDLGFYFKPDPDIPALVFTWYLVQIFGGLSTTFVTNVIAYVVAIIAKDLRSYDIKKNFAFIMFFVVSLAFFPALIIALADLRALGPNSQFVRDYFLYGYAGVRIASITFNFLACLFLTWKLRSMGWSFTYRSSSQPIHPVCALASRMVYYPLIQVLTRIAAAWMEFGYPDNDDSVINAETSTTAYKLADATYSISGPSAGIGFLIIFLYMQPEAWTHLMHLLTCSKYSGGGSSSGKLYQDGNKDIQRGSGGGEEGLLKSTMHEHSVSICEPEDMSKGSYTNDNNNNNNNGSRNASSDRDSVASGNSYISGYSHRSSYSHNNNHQWELPTKYEFYAQFDDDELSELVDKINSPRGGGGGGVGAATSDDFNSAASSHSTTSLLRSVSRVSASSSLRAPLVDKGGGGGGGV